MTVLEAMNLLGLDERPIAQADLESVMVRALEQTPRQRELLEEARDCLSADLETRASAESRLTSIERHQTREILLFDENRDAVMFGDQDAPELPVAFQASLVDDELWMGDDSVIFEGETAMMSEFTAAPVTPAAPIANLDAPSPEPLPETSVSGEWQLMLESLEAEGLVKPEEGFSDALSLQMVATHDTLPEHLAVDPAPLSLDSPIFAPLEPAVDFEESTLPSSQAALLETPLFSTPLFAAPLHSATLSQTPVQQSYSLETPLFADSPLPTPEQAQVITFDESLLISHGGSLTNESDQSIGQPRPQPVSTAPVSAAPASVGATKSLETLPSRKSPEAAQLSIKPAAAQPSEPASKPVTGRGGIAPSNDALREERRSPRSVTAQSSAPRTYRDARESPGPVRRRRQPVALWLLSVAALLGSAVFIAPNLAAQLRDQLLLVSAAPVKPSAPAVVKPPVRVVKPAAIRPPRAAKPVGQTVAKPSTTKPSAAKPSAAKPNASRPSAVKPVLGAQPSAPRAQTVVTPSRSAVTAARGATPAKTAAPVSKAPRVIAAISSAASLPPVTRPEGFAASGVAKPAKPATVKPAAAPAKLVVKPVAAPAPVTSIEYQDKPAAAVTLPGGLSRQEFGRQFLNRKQFEVWQSQQLSVRFESFAQIPLETQVLDADAFRAAVLVPLVRPVRPERP